ncbi:MAG: TolC family protein [Bacteroidota bacterium]
MSFIKTILFWLCMLAGFTSNAQSLLDDYIKEGLENNQQFLIHQIEVEESKLALAEAKGAYMPKASFEASYTLAGGGRAIGIPIGDLLNPVYSSLNLLTNTEQFPQVANVNEQFLPNDFHETKIRVIQPLFNADIYYNSKIKRTMQSIAEAKMDTYEKELIKEIKISYYNYANTLRAEKIYQANEKYLTELVRFNTKRFDEGLITKDQVYKAQFQLQSVISDKATVVAQKVAAKAYFNFLLNKDHDSPVEVNDQLPTDVSNAYTPDQALENRMELMQIRMAKRAQEQVGQLAVANRYLPQVNLVGDAGFQGFGYSFDSSQDFWLLNVGLSWNLFSGFQNKHEAEQSKVRLSILDRQETELKRKIMMEVVSARAKVASAKSKLNASQLALREADKAFKIVDSRYREGQALILEYLDAQSSLLTAQLQQSISAFELQSSMAVFERAIAY